MRLRGVSLAQILFFFSVTMEVAFMNVFAELLLSVLRCRCTVRTAVVVVVVVILVKRGDVLSSIHFHGAHVFGNNV